MLGSLQASKHKKKANRQPENNVSCRIEDAFLKVTMAAISPLVLLNNAIGSALAMENPSSWKDLGFGIGEGNLDPGFVLLKNTNFREGSSNPFFVIGSGHCFIP